MYIFDLSSGKPSTPIKQRLSAEAQNALAVYRRLQADTSNKGKAAFAAYMLDGPDTRL